MFYKLLRLRGGFLFTLASEFLQQRVWSCQNPLQKYWENVLFLVNVQRADGRKKRQHENKKETVAHAFDAGCKAAVKLAQVTQISMDVSAIKLTQQINLYKRKQLIVCWPWLAW